MLLLDEDTLELELTLLLDDETLELDELTLELEDILLLDDETLELEENPAR